MNDEHIYEFKVKDFATLVKMWMAGNGTFYFKNTMSKMELTVTMNTYLNGRKKSDTFVDAGLLYRPLTDIKKPVRKLLHICKIDLDKNRQFLINDEPLARQRESLIKGFNFIHKIIITGQEIPREISVWYNGNCCRCKRQLSQAKSLETGFGEECAEYYHNSKPSIQFKTGL